MSLEGEGRLTEQERQSIIDGEHLRLLALFHYISGAVTIAFSSLFIFHLVFMSVMLAHPQKFQGHKGAVDFPMLPFAVAFGMFIALGITLGVLEILSGRFIAKRKHRVFSLLVAAPRAIFFPWGTTLSVVTYIVLLRKSVKDAYRESA